jgi:hypothetical protein
MAKSVQLTLTRSYGTDGAPSIDIDDRWLNLDQVVSIEEQISRPLRGRRPTSTVDEYFPCFGIAMCNGEQWILPLAAQPTSVAALEALRVYSIFLDCAATDVDAELLELHQELGRADEI